VTPLEFHGDLRRQNIRLPGLLCGVVFEVELENLMLCMYKISLKMYNNESVFENRRAFAEVLIK